MEGGLNIKTCISILYRLQKTRIIFYRTILIESIKQNNTEYDNWWAERFKFESIDKSFKDIRKMKSNAKKDVNRKPKYKTEIDSLKDIFY
jgi:hypothetical protein